MYISSSNAIIIIIIIIIIASNQIKLYFPTNININKLYMMKYTYWKKGWERS